MNEIKEYIAQSKKESEEIQKAFIAVVILTATLAIISLVIGFKHIELGIDYEELQAEKENLQVENEELKGLTETQRSMISDLEENCKDLYIEIENLKFGGNE